MVRPAVLKMSRNVYLTVCATENYLPGVLALRHALTAVGSHYPLKVVVNQNADTHFQSLCKDYGLETIQSSLRETMADETRSLNVESGVSNWNFTLDKLSIFGLAEFDAVVFLDSDMLIRKNIDWLFSAGHMSACKAGASVADTLGVAFNSGLMVIHPQDGLDRQLFKLIQPVSRKSGAFSDNDVLCAFYNDWDNRKDLHLPESMNLLFPYAEQTMETLHLNAGDISVVHFIGAKKPWMLRDQEESIKALSAAGKKHSALFLSEYIDILAKQ